MTTSSVYIQDKNGKHYKTLCGADYTAPEIRNMQRHLEAANKNPTLYHFLDLPTCVIMVDNKPYAGRDYARDSANKAAYDTMTDDELLKALLD